MNKFQELKDVPTEISNYNDIDLVRYIAFAPRDTRTWQQAFFEFDKRFNRFIGTVIYRKCNQLAFQRGQSHLQDYIQDVYHKLLKNDREGLKRFTGEHRNQFLRYLQTTAIRILLNQYHRDEIAPTHSPTGGLQSLDKILDGFNEGESPDLKSIIPDPNGIDEFKKNEIIEEIKYCLDFTQKKNKQKERNILVFMLHLFAGFSADEIAQRKDISISSKRISNLLTEMKKFVERCLRKRFQE
jgi:DNA-directed RNA polymerase specialized sigma24 family protein